MKFRSEKIQSNSGNWSVVLNPLKSELDRKRVGEKISELFRVSYEEARELVRNTPIILLDQLTHPEAIQVQGVLQGVRAEITLTSDHQAKRRCYRAVWPEAPRLSFLETAPPLTTPVTTFPSPAPVTIPEPAAKQKLDSFPSPSMFSLDSLSDAGEDTEKKELRKRCQTLELLFEEKTKENEQLKQNFEQELKKHSEKVDTNRRSFQQEWDERYQGLKTESQESKAIYEEKILAQQNEIKVLRERFAEIELWQRKAMGLERQTLKTQERMNPL